MDISYNQQKLFNVIDRSYITDGYSGRPAERGVMIMNYTDKINARSYANYPHQIYSQFDVATHIGCNHHIKSDIKGIKNINCTPRENEGASRFNYANDRQIDKRMVDVSGILIPNNQLRVIPNRGIPLCYQERNIPTNQAILNLAQSIGNISASDLDKTFNLSKSNLKFKASRQKLTREELLGLARKPTKGFVFGKSNVVPAVPAMIPPVAPVPRSSLNSRLSTAPTPGRTPSQMVEDRKRGRAFNERPVRPFG
jgi:hypothetical protein